MLTSSVPLAERASISSACGAVGPSNTLDEYPTLMMPDFLLTLTLYQPQETTINCVPIMPSIETPLNLIIMG